METKTTVRSANLTQLNRREHEAMFSGTYLGANTKMYLQPIMDEIKEEIGNKQFILQCIQMYMEDPDQFEKKPKTKKKRKASKKRSR